MMFSLWPLPKVEAAIISIEEGLARNVMSVSNPAQGGVAYRSKEEAESILASLYNRYYHLTGTQTAMIGKPRIFSLRRVDEY